MKFQLKVSSIGVKLVGRKWIPPKKFSICAIISPSKKFLVSHNI